MFFASMAGTPSRARSDVNNNNKIFRIVLKDTPAGSSFEDKVYKVRNGPQTAKHTVEQRPPGQDRLSACTNDQRRDKFSRQGSLER